MSGEEDRAVTMTSDATWELLDPDRLALRRESRLGLHNASWLDEE
jgi:hypothetical protein